MQGSLQGGECRQARKIFASLNALDITRACSDSFSELFLGQIPASSQQGDVSSEFGSLRTAFGFARRHRRILPKMRALKHEALPRINKFLI